MGNINHLVAWKTAAAFALALLLFATAQAQQTAASSSRVSMSARSTKPSHSKRSTTKRSAKSARHSPPAQTAPTPERISEIQSALAGKGAYKGDFTGKWDEPTVDAMKQFQSAHGLNPSGKLDALTLERLGLGADTAGRGAPLPTSSPSANLLLSSGAPTQASSDAAPTQASSDSRPAAR